jgi:hypothetical protein
MITDFGLSKLMNEEDPAHNLKTACGTPGYVGPCVPVSPARCTPFPLCADDVSLGDDAMVRQRPRCSASVATARRSTCGASVSLPTSCKCP